MIQDTSSQDVILTKSKTVPTKLIVVVAIVLVLSFLFYSLISNWAATDQSVDRSRLRIASVEKGMFVRDISLQGNIIAANSPKLYSPSVGTVTLLFNPGEIVKQGDIVAKVASPTLINQLQQEKAKLVSLNIEYERQKIATKQAKIKSEQQIKLEAVILNAAKREKRRAEKSIKIQAVSQLDYEKALDDLERSQLKHDFAIKVAELENENLVFELKARQSELNQHRLLVENTERLVNELTIKAPVSGIVGSWSVEQKSAISVNQALLTIVDLSAFQVEIDIPESYADELGIGMLVKVKYNQKDYDAEIITISPEVTNNVVKGRVAFLQSPPPGIKQNQRVTSRVILEQKDNVLYLSRGSFIQHHSGLKVFVVEEDRATLTDVKLGSRSIAKVEVILGLTEGQRVIISNTDFVNDAKTLNLN
ncbi:MAG: efflux transporter periplasmic adaptor subunit [Kangiella sp.]|nr:MAG: efflux transporter periplasmic adaptor subunit [Kangiella sp.]